MVEDQQVLLDTDEFIDVEDSGVAGAQLRDAGLAHTPGTHLIEVFIHADTAGGFDSVDVIE